MKRVLLGLSHGLQGIGSITLAFFIISRACMQEAERELK